MKSESEYELHETAFPFMIATLLAVIVYRRCIGTKSKMVIESLLYADR